MPTILILSREFQAGFPWEDIYADDLVIIADSPEECVRRLLMWKKAMQKKGVEGKRRKDKGHDLWYRPGPLVEFSRMPMRCLSYRSWATTASTAMAANFWGIRNAVCYND